MKNHSTLQTPIKFCAFLKLMKFHVHLIGANKNDNTDTDKVISYSSTRPTQYYYLHYSEVKRRGFGTSEYPK